MASDWIQSRAMSWCSGTGNRNESICSSIYSIDEEILNKLTYSHTERVKWRVKVGGKGGQKSTNNQFPGSD